VFSLSDDQRSVSIYSWDHSELTPLPPPSPRRVADQYALHCTDAFSYRKTSDSLQFPAKVHNIVPGDFNYDGKLDLLVMLEHDEGWWNEAIGLDLRIYLQDGEGHFSQYGLKYLSEHAC
jgi:integrin alpha FG-GAP repeat containing protein 1